ncbi:MAG: DUF1294 domain-containing protein [Verrucomicrobiota bacterium]
MSREEKTNGGGGAGGFPTRLLWLLPVPVVALVVLGTRLGWWWLPVSVMLVVSAVTYGLFASDKRRAQSGTWRISEATLHLFELAGGWPGAVLAQQRLRHKSSKGSYRFVLWVIIVAHQYLAVDFLLGWKVARWVTVLIGGL